MMIRRDIGHWWTALGAALAVPILVAGLWARAGASPEDDPRIVRLEHRAITNDWSDPNFDPGESTNNNPYFYRETERNEVYSDTVCWGATHSVWVTFTSRTGLCYTVQFTPDTRDYFIPLNWQWLDAETNLPRRISTTNWITVSDPILALETNTCFAHGQVYESAIYRVIEHQAGP